MAQQPRCHIAVRFCRALTLVETLVTIAVIGVLIAILLPAIQAAREASRRASCQNNLRQIGVSAINYADAHADRLPASWRTVRDDAGVDSLESPIHLAITSFSWRTTILPYMEQQALESQFDFKSTPLAPANANAVGTLLSVYQCPSTPGSPRLVARDSPGGTVQLGAADYSHVHFLEMGEVRYDKFGGGEGHAGAWYGLDRCERLPNIHYADRKGARNSAPMKWISDGLSNTILVAEKSGFPMRYGPDGEMLNDQQWASGEWAASEFGGFGEADVNWLNFPSIYAFHPGGAMVVMCDGSTAFMSEETDRQVIVQKCSRDDETKSQ